MPSGVGVQLPPRAPDQRKRGTGRCVHSFRKATATRLLPNLRSVGDEAVAGLLGGVGQDDAIGGGVDIESVAHVAVAKLVYGVAFPPGALPVVVAQQAAGRPAGVDLGQLVVVTDGTTFAPAISAWSGRASGRCTLAS